MNLNEFLKYCYYFDTQDGYMELSKYLEREYIKIRKEKIKRIIKKIYNN